jgi:hypothetical protein
VLNSVKPCRLRFTAVEGRGCDLTGVAMAKAKPLSRREFSLVQNNGAMPSNIQNPKATSHVREACHPSLASSLGWVVWPRRALVVGVNPRAQGMVATSWCDPRAAGSKTNKAGMFLRFIVIELVTARSIKDSNCAAPAADRAGVLGGVASN